MNAATAETHESDAHVLKRLRGILKRRVIQIAEAIEGFGAPANDVDAERALKTVALLEKVMAQVFNGEDLAEAARAAPDDLGDDDRMYTRRPVGNGPDALDAWRKIIERKLADGAAARRAVGVDHGPDLGRTGGGVRPLGELGTGRTEDT